jgi:DNA (cytosine-5)-methyltransferase 1
MRSIIASDHFCGGGGTSTGLARAVAKKSKYVNLLAINHWKRAVETHEANFPWARHILDDLRQVNPREVVPGRHLDILVTSPECTYHSKALGGKPINDQSRMTAQSALRWVEEIDIDAVLIENVPEFMDWGPLDDQNRPVKRERGRFFLTYINAFRERGYKLEHRILCAADYGAPTTRERLFIQARKDGKSIVWPDPTHSRDGDYGRLFGTRERRVPAREIIDWSNRGESIFTRKKPLQPTTLARIEKGLRRFALRPFLTTYHGSSYPGGERVRSVDDPMPTMGTSNQFGLCEPFIVKYYATGGAQSVDDPLDTVTTRDRFGLCQPYIVAVNHGDADNRSYSVDRPFPTVTSVDAWGICQPFLVNFYGRSTVQGVDNPVGTITGKDHFGLCVPVDDGYAIIDILFRMLTPRELAAAMSFPRDYIWCGNRSDTVKMAGNSVPPILAESIIYEMI